MIKSLGSASNGVCACMCVWCAQVTVACADYADACVCVGGVACREQLYAQIQADAAVKKTQEEKIRDLESALNGGTPGGPMADSGGGSGGGGRASETRIRELESICNTLRSLSRSLASSFARARALSVSLPLHLSLELSLFPLSLSVSLSLSLPCNFLGSSQPYALSLFLSPSLPTRPPPLLSPAVSQARSLCARVLKACFVRSVECNKNKCNNERGEITRARRDQLEATEVKLAEERSRHQQEVCVPCTALVVLLPRSMYARLRQCVCVSVCASVCVCVCACVRACASARRGAT